MFTRLNTSITTESATIEGVYMIAVIERDNNPDTSYLDQEGWSKRKRQYKRGDFSHVGVMVRAYDEDDREINRDSVWGIESDSEPSYFAEVANELAAELTA